MSERQPIYNAAPIRTQSEVAAIMGISRSHVYQLERRALEKLRKRLQAYEQQENE